MRKLCILVCPSTNYVSYNWQRPLMPDAEMEPHAPISCLTEARGSDVRGGVAYMTELCCPACAKALDSAGIKKIVYQKIREEDDGSATREVLRYYDIEEVYNPSINLDKIQVN